jgi:hypothetical protein
MKTVDHKLYNATHEAKLTFVNCYFQEVDNGDIGTTHSVQQQNLFNASNELFSIITSKRQS